MTDFRQVARRKAVKYGVDPDLFEAQIDQESGFAPDVIYGRRSSSAGAQGIAQFMPGTAASVGVNPLKPRRALDAAAKLMSTYIKQFGSPEKALAAYNAGPGNAENYQGISETRNYVANIMAAARKSGKVTNRPTPGGGGAPGGGGGGGVVVPGSGATSTPAAGQAGVVALLQALGNQRQAPAVAGSLPSPAFAAGPRLPTGFQSAPGGGGGAAPEKLDVGSLLGLVQGGMTADTVTPGSSPSVVGAPAGGAGGGGGAPRNQRTLVVGDSLGVGTAPFLAKQLGGRVDVHAAVGRSSQRGVRALRNAVAKHDYGRIVMDLGTNDASAQELARSVRRARALAPNAEIVIPTVNGPGAAQKNRTLRRLAGGNVKVVDLGVAPNAGDGIHYDSSGYQSRAGALVGALGGRGGALRGSGGAKGVKPGIVLESFYNGAGGANTDSGKAVGRGFVDGHTDHVHFAARTHQEAIALAKVAQRRFGLAVRELEPFDHVDPVHTHDSFHYRGLAADVSGPPEKMAAFSRWVARYR